MSFQDLADRFVPRTVLSASARKTGEMAFIAKDPPLLHCLSAETVAKITYLPDQKIMIVKEPLDENELQQVKNCFSSSESQQAFEHAYHQQESKHKDFSANREENFSIPVLAIKKGDLFEQFEETHFLEVEWNLATCNVLLLEGEFPVERLSGQQSEIYVTEQGRISTRFLSELQQQMTFLTTDQQWTVAQLVYWLDHSIHPKGERFRCYSGKNSSNLKNFSIKHKGLSRISEKPVHVVKEAEEEGIEPSTT